MTQVIGTFRIGENAVVALDLAGGTAPEGATVTAAMVRGRLLGQFVADRGAAAVPLTVTPRAASGSIPAGWNLTLSAAASAALSAGTYGIDARFALAGGAVEITDEPAVIRLTPAITA